MPAAAHSSATDSPAASALASISDGVRTTAGMPPGYLHVRLPVKSSIALRHEPSEYAQNAAMETDDEREAVKQFLRDAAAKCGLSLSALAQRAGLTPSTLTRFMLPQTKHMLTRSTLAKIAAVSGYALPPMLGEDRTDLNRAFIEAFARFGEAVGVDLVDAAALSGVDPAHLRRLQEWLELIRRLPPNVEPHAFQIMLGLTEAQSPGPQQKPNDETNSGGSRLRA